MDVSKALRARIETSVAGALAEDIGDGDVSAALISPAAEARGVVVARQDGVFCGRPWVEEVARQMGGAFEADWHVRDGADLSAGQTLFELHGQARAILTAERTVLNFVQLLSGTATRARRFVLLLEGTGCQLLDTRKTLPGLRLAQKYAVRLRRRRQPSPRPVRRLSHQGKPHRRRRLHRRCRRPGPQAPARPAGGGGSGIPDRAWRSVGGGRRTPSCSTTSPSPKPSRRWR